MFHAKISCHYLFISETSNSISTDGSEKYGFIKTSGNITYLYFTNNSAVSKRYLLQTRKIDRNKNP
jgi:hypothetical protein